MRSVFAGLIAAPLAFGATPAVASTPERLERTGKWVVNYDRDACHLLAQFGSGKDAVILQFTRYEPGDSFDLKVIGGRLGRDTVDVKAKLTFGAGEPFNAYGMGGTAGKREMALFSNVRLVPPRAGHGDGAAGAITPAMEAAVTELRIERRGRPLVLAFGSLAAPMAQMRECMDSLLASWGYDPAVQAALLRTPAPLSAPARWLTADDYPQMAAMMGLNGIVQFRLDVDARGNVAGCYVLARSNPDEFADLTCRAVAKRAKFDPALGPDGKPIRSYFIKKVKWRARP